MTCLFSFFFNDTATTAIYTLSLHDALPICGMRVVRSFSRQQAEAATFTRNGHLMARQEILDRKSTRLNSSHMSISYAVFCLKKKMDSKSHPFLSIVL